MRYCHRLLWSLTVAAVTLSVTGVCQRDVYAAPPDPVDKDMAALGKSLEGAFNTHDADALSALWTENAVYHSASTGREFSGRQAIRDAYAKLFAEGPEGTLSIEVRSAKVKSDQAAVFLGVAQVSHPGQEPTRSMFEATLERAGTAWLIARVDETDLPAESAAGLNALEWLVGRWVEELPSGRVVSEFRWVDGGAFLLRNYWCDRQDAPRVQGTQIFGWDAEQVCIRTWLFDSTGSFGEGHWQAEGPTRWVNKLVTKLPDGRRGSVTQVMERISDDKMSLQLVDRDIDGAAQPNGPVATLARTAEQPKKKSPAHAGPAKGKKLP